MKRVKVQKMVGIWKLYWLGILGHHQGYAR